MAESIDPAFLRNSELFESQPDEVIRAVLAQGQLLEFGPGEVVFHQGDQGDRLFVVKSGVLEVLSTPSDASEAVPIAYLGTGEVLGELALLTGSPRSATVRSPEHAELFAVERAVFIDLMDTLPAFSRNLCVVLARRLETTTLKVPRASGKQLQGSLKYFDLATVIQTLIGSHQTGNLTVTHRKKKTAELFFYSGNIYRARYRHLAGDDAVYQLFQGTMEGDFSFTGREVAEDEVQSEVSLPAISLLMESVRLQDELPMLKERVPDPDRAFRQKGEHLLWEETDSVELAAAVWSRLKKGASVRDLERDIPRCSYAIYRTLAALLDAGQIE
ncbi:MAG: cyclic nucleotide-binding domain-containing protein [Acidobacteria bacterium]|jgi:CRP-like cAMP-binding protein|nr:cyclic nucleotide-binding domain-containing protein [Acidobacteriota bacterium]